MSYVKLALRQSMFDLRHFMFNIRQVKLNMRHVKHDMRLGKLATWQSECDMGQMKLALW